MIGTVYRIKDDKNINELNYKALLLKAHEWSVKKLVRNNTIEFKITNDDRDKFTHFLDTFKQTSFTQIDSIVIFTDKIRIYHMLSDNIKAYSEFLSIEDRLRIHGRIIRRFNVRI